MHAAKLDTADFATELREDIASKRVRLPSLPEVALRVRDAVEQGSATAPEISRLVSQDVALSGRLLQVANSPLYRGKVEADNLQMAITRLGVKLVRNLVVSLAMKQLFQTSSRLLTHYFRGAWDDSVQVAAISRYLADGIAHIDPEQAMLGGLLHNIGALPVLARIDELDQAITNALVEDLLIELVPQIGTQILQSWNFPAALSSMPTDCLDLYRDTGPELDYADIVLAARLQHLVAAGRIEMQAEWADIPAHAKLGINVEVVILADDGPAAWIGEVRSALDG